MSVENRAQGEERRQETRVDAAGDLLRAAAGFPWRAAAGRPSGLPDEPRYRILVVRGGTTVYERELWRSELEARPELSRLIEEFQRIVERASDGRILL